MSIDFLARAIAAQATTGAASSTFSNVVGYAPGTMGRKLQEAMSVRDYGAKGDGTTDDTAALQAAINAACTTYGGQLQWPAGTYKITAALSIPFSCNWAFHGAGRGRAVISQATANTPILKLVGGGTWGFVIEELGFTWATPQPATNTQAIAIYFNPPTAGDTIYHWQVRRCDFTNGFRGIMGTQATASVPIWGCNIDKCTFHSNMTGASIFLIPSPAVGCPRITVTDCMFDAASASEALVQIAYSDTLALRDLEFLNGTAPISVLNITSCNGVVIDNCRSENFNAGTVTTSNYIWRFNQVTVTFVNCGIIGVLGTGAYAVGLLGDAFSRFTIVGLNAGSAITSGGLTAYYCGGEVTFVDKVACTGTATDNSLTYVGIANPTRVNAQAKVFDKVDTRADVAVTMTATSGRVQLFNATLTANRRCSLPATGMYIGQEFDIVRNAATPGAFTLQGYDPLSGVNYTTPSGSNGWQRWRYLGGQYVLVGAGSM